VHPLRESQVILCEQDPRVRDATRKRSTNMIPVLGMMPAVIVDRATAGLRRRRRWPTPASAGAGGLMVEVRDRARSQRRSILKPPVRSLMGLRSSPRPPIGLVWSGAEATSLISAGAPPPPLAPGDTIAVIAPARRQQRASCGTKPRTAPASVLVLPRATPGSLRRHERSPPPPASGRRPIGRAIF
jgi:hypothetical protein